jgi:hypothetical protein
VPNSKKANESEISVSRKKGDGPDRPLRRQMLSYHKRLFIEIKKLNRVIDLLNSLKLNVICSISVLV